MGSTIRFFGLALAPALSLALANSHAASPAQQDPYAEECGSCHIAYPANLMPKQDWNRLLGRLDRHFGVDASLDATTLQQVAKRLGATPGGTLAGSVAAPVPRISTQPWFQKEHREIPAARFRSPAVKSTANCSACHAGAERGVFEGTEESDERGHHDD